MEGLQEGTPNALGDVPGSSGGGSWHAGFCAVASAALWDLLGALDLGGALAALRMGLLYVGAFCQSAAAELYAFATADTCDGTFAALFFGALCAYLLIVRNRVLPRELETGPATAAVTVSPALAGQAFWEKYDAAQGWKSNIAAAGKTGNKSQKSLLWCKLHSKKISTAADF
jgi:hypothetical protein